MAKKSLEITGPNIDKNIGMVQRAYAFDMQPSHYFQYIANNIEGLGILFEHLFGEAARGEQGHAVELKDRLMEFGTNPTDDPAIWAAESGIGKTKAEISIT